MFFVRPPLEERHQPQANGVLVSHAHEVRCLKYANVPLVSTVLLATNDGEDAFRLTPLRDSREGPQVKL
jgi:hypothetical protein